jgi:hypothetical protein
MSHRPTQLPDSENDARRRLFVHVTLSNYYSVSTWIKQRTVVHLEAKYAVGLILSVVLSVMRSSADRLKLSYKDTYSLRFRKYKIF